MEAEFKKQVFEAYEKCCKVFESCEREEQFYYANRMMNLFFDLMMSKAQERTSLFKKIFFLNSEEENLVWLLYRNLIAIKDNIKPKFYSNEIC